MRITSMVATTLPNLRRYARAVTGSQTAGDDLVAQVLEDLVAEPTLMGGEQPVNIALYRQFLRLLNTRDDGMDAAAEEAETIADKRLGRLSPRPRQAYLLRALEGFSAEESAYALDASPHEVTDLVDRANREMIDQVATDVLIIEDEPMIALDLKDIMTSLGHRVVAVARTHQEALEAIGEAEVGLVLADIQLADGSSGIEAVNDILQSIGVPIVFITAFPERLLTGERPEPTFLITKPFLPENIKAITSQALFFDLKAERRAAPAETKLSR
jgi:CheY-like chemotaxis protein/DNA-directed RNA polymerase specialized sigma24 family protein